MNLQVLIPLFDRAELQAFSAAMIEPTLPTCGDGDTRARRRMGALLHFVKSGSRPGIGLFAGPKAFQPALVRLVEVINHPGDTLFAPRCPTTFPDAGHSPLHDWRKPYQLRATLTSTQRVFIAIPMNYGVGPLSKILRVGPRTLQ